MCFQVFPWNVCIDFVILFASLLCVLGFLHVFVGWWGFSTGEPNFEIQKNCLI
jgi:hypothetical protein